MNVGRTWLAILPLTFVAAASAPAAETQKSAPARTAWKIKGQLEEACSCSAACPCWFGSKPTRMSCGGGQFLFIEKGNYGGVPLDGLAVGSMVESADGQSMGESFGKWKFNYFYIDEKANPEQRKALEALATEVLLGDVSPKRETRYVPIARTIDGDLHRITLGQYGSFSGHLMEGGLGGHPKIVDPPMADPLHHEYEQGTATSLKYTDNGLNWNYEGSNYMHGTFEIDSDQYAKFEEAFAKKMAGAKKP